MLESGTPVLRVGNLFTSHQWYYSDLELEEDKYCDSGDLIYAWSASFGPFIWAGPKAIFHYHIWKLGFFSATNLNKSFLYTYLLEKTQEIKASGHGIAMAHMTKEKMEKLVLPVPPLEEQSRIVAKVDQLMALCDELETKQSQRAETHAHLIHAAHQPLTQPRDHAEFHAAWQRIRDNFDGLHTTVDSVKALRQTILQLAVQGKLVPQDPNDEPASVLLEKISAEKERLIAEGKIKKTKQLPIDPEEVPFEVPEGWETAHFSGVASIRSNLVKPDAFPRAPHVAPDNIEKETARLLPYNTVAEDGVTSSKHRFFPGQLLYSKIRPNLSKLVIVDFGGLCSADMYPVDPHIDPDFLKYFMLSKLFLEQVTNEENRLAMPKVNQGQLNSVIALVPPLPEQSRIVAKVDQLMTLCDDLEAKIEANQTKAQRFAEAVEAELAA